MADYRLTQTGDQVQSLLNQVTPNQQAIEGLQSDKVDKVEGKGLSDENFTEGEKTKLGNLPTQSELNTELGKKATIVSLGEETQARQQADNTLQGNIDAIEAKIPAAASAQNKLVDEQKMNSSIATETATYRGSYNLVTDLHLTISATESDIANALAATVATADNNDYCYIQIPVANDKPTEIARIDRYKFNGTAWALEYTLNNSGFTAAQWDAINSGITSGLVAKLNALPNNAELIALLAAKAPQATTYTKSEVDALIANFITASVNNLVNYYLKSDTYTKLEIQQLIDAVKQFTYVSVAELPTASADTMNKIYLVPSTNPETTNVKDEFITIAVTDQGTTTYSWEQIGSTTIDLSGYYTIAQTDAAILNALSPYSTTLQMNAAITSALNTALAEYSTTTQMNAAIAAAIANYYTKSEVDALIANFITASVNNLVNYYLKSDTYTKAEVQQLIDSVKQFTYISVAELPTASADTMNKIYLVPSTNPETQNVKDEYITISATDQGLTTYSWEQIGTTTVDLSGYYTSAQTDAAITAALASYATTSAMNTAIAAALVNYYTKTEIDAALLLKQDVISDLSSIRAGAAAGAISAPQATTYTKNEVDALTANFITASVSNLVNYYLKTDTYNALEIDQMLAAIRQFQYEAVQTLPTASASTVGKIYLVPNADPTAQNKKDEYITLTITEEGTTTYEWECIGSTDIDLTNYYTKSQADAAITSAINQALASYSTTNQVGTIVSTAITTALANYYTKAETDAPAINATRQKSVINTLTAKTNTTGYASTDLIQLYANDGTPNGKISRDDLIGVVKDLLPSLLSSQSSGVTNLLSLGTGDALGKTSLADAASLLGDENIFGEQITPTTLQFIPMASGEGTSVGMSSYGSFMSLIGLYCGETTDLNDAFLSVSSGKRMQINFFDAGATNSPTAQNGGFVFSFRHGSSYWGSQFVVSNGGVYHRAVSSYGSTATFGAWKTIIES